MDAVRIDGLRALSRIGCGENERQYPQRLEFDVTVSLDLMPSARSRALEDTICYMDISQLIDKICLSKEWILLEELGDALIQAIFERWPIAHSCEITIKKFPIVAAQHVSIVMRQNRS